MKRPGVFSMKDKRRCDRVSVRVKVNHDHENTITIRNLSQSGMCVLSEDPLEEGRYFSRMFPLPDGKNINVFGKIVWTSAVGNNTGRAGSARNHLSGIEFISINTGDKESIALFVESALSSSI